jgi:uncharacterized protein (DUF1499 family)
MRLFPGVRPSNLASRLGVRDFGVNRARIEALRTQLATWS